MSRLANVAFAGLAAAFLWLTMPGLNAAFAGEPGLRRIGARVDIDDNAMTGLMAGGAELSVKGRSSGRVALFGADIQENAEIADGLYAIGANIAVAGPIKGDAELYGSKVSLTSPVDGNVTLVGSRIEIGPAARIGGSATLTGSYVSFAGQALGATVIEASEIEFAGSAKGHLRLESPKIHIASGAIIDGDVDVYTITDPKIDPDAKISGHINRFSLSEVSAARAMVASGPVAQILPGLFLLGSALMAGLMFLWLGRGGAEGAIDELIDSPAASGLWGLLGLVLLPLVALVLALTIIGAPVGVLAVLALPLLLLLGYACAGLGVGEWFFNRIGEPRSTGLRALHLLAGLVCLGVLGFIPVAGPVVIAIATLCGFGALVRMLHDRLQGAAKG